LDIDKNEEPDFGDLKSSVLTEISKQEFQQQLDNISDRLAKENSELLAILKTREAEFATISKRQILQ